MKTFASQLSYVRSERETRRNMKAFLRFLGLLAAIIAIYSALFHVVMLYAEGQDHTWVTGVYWTLTVMSTLGFGDITFHSDIGRLFSIVVLMTGIVFLLILLPFAFIRYFYAPWMEAQLRLRAPREAKAETAGHVILCHFDEIARHLIDRLRLLGIPYYVIEPDAATAAQMHNDGLSVIAGDVDSRDTYVALAAERSRLIVANLDDVTNTNITLTVREHAPDVPVAAFVEDKDSIDILELSGATDVLPLKHRLGQQLAARVTAGAAATHVVGRFRDLVIAEFPVHNTSLAGRTIRETRLREVTGLNVVGYWERGKLRPASPDAVLGTYSVILVVGTQAQLEELDAMMVIYRPNENPVVVIGGGKIGRACCRALRASGTTVHLIERNPELVPALEAVADGVFVGDAADLNVVTRAGIEQAPSVVLSTNDDATNIYLAVYCRKLNPHLHIVSRINHERNVEAIHRAGADIVLSQSSVGVQLLLSLLLGREAVMLGEGVDLFIVDVPTSLAGRTLAETNVGARTGLNVIAVQSGEQVVQTPDARAPLDAGSQLVAIGNREQREQFERLFVRRA